VVIYVLALLILYPLLTESLGVIAAGIFLIVSPLFLSGRAMLAALANETLDERELKITNTGFTHAYWILVSLLLVNISANFFFRGDPEAFPRLYTLILLHNEVLFEFWTLLLVAIVLPACVVAWLEPDPIPADMELIAEL
jgi:hypothetical protein